MPTAVSLITRITGDDYNVVLADCRAHKTFCWVARKANDETIERINSLKLQGIHFQKEPKRFYPARDLAAQVLGSVGMEDSGQSGIEHAFDDELRGHPGKMFISVDARKKWFADVETQPDPGDNLVLTIDKNIQYIAEKELEQAIHDTQAIAGTVIVENPHTGEILALANRPTFNPNLRKQITPGALTNRAVSYVYEPGSTFKLVTISAALEEKLTNPNEVFDCQMGSIVYNGMRIRDSKPHGLLPVWGVLAESSDVGSIKIALRLGEDRFYKYIRAFGFGQQTGIELPGETRGMTKPVSRWSKVSIAAISMGQEIGISPIQLTSLISTFANDGVWVAPRILTGTVQPQGTPQTVAFHPGASHRVISSYTAAEMRSMMQKVVLEGTGRKAILEGYTSAGKTGTAQKVDPATGAYSKTKYIGSFAGFAPLNNPQIVVAVILDSAVGLHQGGQVSAPVFKRISQQVLEYLHVPHDLPLAPQHQLLMAAAKTKDKDLEEGTPDHPGRAAGNCGCKCRLCRPSEAQCGAAPFGAAAPATAGSRRNKSCKRQCVKRSRQLRPRDLVKKAPAKAVRRRISATSKIAYHRNRRSRRRTRRNRSAIVRRQDGARRGRSRSGRRSGTGRCRQRRSAPAVSRRRNARGCRGAGDGAVRAIRPGQVLLVGIFAYSVESSQQVQARSAYLLPDARSRRSLRPGPQSMFCRCKPGTDRWREIRRACCRR